MEISTILYATDGSAHARKALEWVGDIAQRPAQGEALTRAVAGILQARGVPCEQEVLEGPPAEAILKVAGVQHADLIVMGSRGLGRVEAALLGSVSQRVVQEASCPVLIVR